LLIIVFGKAAREKTGSEIGYDHNGKTERLIINNRIVVVLLFFYYCIAILLPVWLVRLCGWLVCCAVGWFMGDLNKPLLFRERATARQKARTSGRAAQATRNINLLKL